MAASPPRESGSDAPLKRSAAAERMKDIHIVIDDQHGFPGGEGHGVSGVPGGSTVVLPNSTGTTIRPATGDWRCSDGPEIAPNCLVSWRILGRCQAPSGPRTNPLLATRSLPSALSSKYM